MMSERTHPDAATWAGQPQPWDRREEETPRAYEAFLVYRDMGAARSQVKVGRMLGKHPTLIERWSREHGWVARVAAFDHDQAQRASADRAAARQAAVDRHAAVAGGILAQAARLITPPEFRPDGATPLTAEERARWRVRPDTLRIAARALAEAATVQRLAFGLPTTITRQTVETEEAVKAALEAQRVVESIVREYLDPACNCPPCQRTREQLRRLFAHQQRARALIST